MASFYRSNIKVGGQDKVVVAIYHNEEDTTQAVVESTVVERLHHIHILDRSGSMYSSIDELIDNVQKTIDVIGADDLLTVVWFAGDGQMRTLLKGATKSDRVVSLLDSIRSTLGCTCFSQALNEVNTILDELGDLAPVSITLFTDGRPVVSHGAAEEERRCFVELGKMSGRIIALNTVAYGNYADEDLLRRFAATSEFGEHVHSSKLGQYLSIFTHNFEKIADVVGESINIEGQDAEIIYLNRTFSKMTSGTFHLSRIDKRKNQFFLFADDGFDFDFTYNGVQYNSATVPVKAALNPAQVANFQYAYAYNMYYTGNRKEALVAISQLRDKALIDSHMNSFTFDESGRHLERLSKALMRPQDCRYTDGIAPEGYVPADDATCLMDVLNELQAGDSFYVPFGKMVPSYKRIGKKTTDEFSLFTQTTEEVRAPFSSFVDNKKKMNLSVLVKIPGTVKLNPKSAGKVGLTTVADSYIWRAYTIIKDGRVNMSRMEVLLSGEDFMNPKINPVVTEFVGHVDIDIEGEMKSFSRCVLDLTSVPVINRMYINEATGIEEIFRYTVESTKLEALQKVIGYHLLKFPETSRKATGQFAVYTDEQIAVLLEHGIAKDGSYNPVAQSQPKAEDCDSYMAREFEFYLAGVSALPSVNAMLERREKIAAEAASGKGKSKFTAAMEPLNEAMGTLEARLAMNNMLLESTDHTVMTALLDMQKDTKQKLQKIRGELSTLKMAKLLSGDWFDLKTDDKGEYFYEENGVKMIARTSYVTMYF